MQIQGQEWKLYETRTKDAKTNRCGDTQTMLLVVTKLNLNHICVADDDRNKNTLESENNTK